MKKNNTEPDRLHIKNKAKQNIVYHYNREERLAMVHKKPVNSSGKGLFRNKILLIIVCDIILIIIIYYIFNNFILKEEKKPDSAARDIYGYSVRFSGYRIKDKVFTRLSIEKVENTGTEESNTSGRSVESFTGKKFNTPAAGVSNCLPTADIRFSIDNGETSVQHMEQLPRFEGEEITVQATLFSSNDKAELSAQVMIGDKTETLLILPLER